MTQVLLLNASYVPMNVIDIKRAVSLMLKDKVIAVDGIAKKLKTPSTIFVVPLVLRMKYYVNVPDKKAVWSKWGVLRRDNYTCVYCGHHSGRRTEFTVDHLIPKTKGGKNSWMNTACSCRVCNHRKANRTPHEAGMKLQFLPKTPRTNYLVLSGQVPREWEIYIKTK